jgi:hypothetical protein
MRVKILRMVRWVQVAGLVLSTVILALRLRTGGLSYTLVPVVLIVVWLALICVQTRLIRRRVCSEWLIRFPGNGA